MKLYNNYKKSYNYYKKSYNNFAKINLPYSVCVVPPHSITSLNII